MTQSRRTFVQQASAAAAMGWLARQPSAVLWKAAPSTHLAAPDEALLKELALKAIDAARAAGAPFADVRVGMGRRLAVGLSVSAKGERRMNPPYLALPTAFGVRVLIDGAWGFSSDAELTVDAVTRAARTAVALARGNRRRHPKELALAPLTTVRDGFWETKIERDAMDISIEEQTAFFDGVLAEAVRAEGVEGGYIGSSWRRSVMVFAATDGSLITQRFAHASPNAVVRVSIGDGEAQKVTGIVDEPLVGGYGYEAIAGVPLAEGFRSATQRALRTARESQGAASVEVGRYDIVFSPQAAGVLVEDTLSQALDSRRALQYMANGMGTSYAAPLDEMLGKYRAAAPSITVLADRNRLNGAATTGWDEEGIRPEPYTIVKDGVITDYHTNRETAPELGFWYSARREPVRSHGCARGGSANIPYLKSPNLTLEPGAAAVSEDDLMGGVKKGLYITGASGLGDQQIINYQAGVNYLSVRYIRNGKLAGHVKDVGFQFITTPFWKSIDGIGGAASATSFALVTDGYANFDDLTPYPHSTVTSVPIRARQVNVLNTGRTA